MKAIVHASNKPLTLAVCGATTQSGTLYALPKRVFMKMSKAQWHKHWGGRCRECFTFIKKRGTQ